MEKSSSKKKPSDNICNQKSQVSFIDWYISMPMKITSKVLEFESNLHQMAIEITTNLLEETFYHSSTSI